MEIDVHSEIGDLQRVLVHCPGDEIVRMTQRDLERMLFDDILAPEETAREHALMCDVLAGRGAEVLELTDLLTEALASASTADRERLVERCCALAGVVEIADVLAALPAERLAHALVSGAYWSQMPEAPQGLAHLQARMSERSDLALDPVPNLMFMRDPCMAVYDSVVMGRMATRARAREPLLVAFALAARGAKLCFDSEDAHRNERANRLEGGDVLVLSDEVLMIGCSIRTSAQTIERLAHEALFPTHPSLQVINVVMMPHARSVMHLDTILTQVDRELFLGHAPLIVGGRGREPLPVARVERDGNVAVVAGGAVLDALRESLGRGIHLVPCGGPDELHQEREQWTDGANAIAIAPGHVVLYARNRHTIDALEQQGFTEIALSVVHSRQERLDRIAQGLQAERAVFSFTGSEMSRARGGGRCLTMPLSRAAVG